MTTYERTCPICGTAFTAKVHNGLYCSAACRAQKDTERIKDGRKWQLCRRCGEKPPVSRNVYCLACRRIRFHERKAEKNEAAKRQYIAAKVESLPDYAPVREPDAPLPTAFVLAFQAERARLQREAAEKEKARLLVGVPHDEAEESFIGQNILGEIQEEVERAKNHALRLEKPLPSAACRFCPGKLDRYGRCARGHQN